MINRKRGKGIKQKGGYEKQKERKGIKQKGGYDKQKKRKRDKIERNEKTV